MKMIHHLLTNQKRELSSAVVYVLLKLYFCIFFLWKTFIRMALYFQALFNLFIQYEPLLLFIFVFIRAVIKSILCFSSNVLCFFVFCTWLHFLALLALAQLCSLSMVSLFCQGCVSEYQPTITKASKIEFQERLRIHTWAVLLIKTCKNKKKSNERFCLSWNISTSISGI